MVDNPLIGPYFWGGTSGRGGLISHNNSIKPQLILSLRNCQWQRQGFCGIGSTHSTSAFPWLRQQPILGYYQLIFGKIEVTELRSQFDAPSLV